MLGIQTLYTNIIYKQVYETKLIQQLELKLVNRKEINLLPCATKPKHIELWYAC